MREPTRDVNHQCYRHHFLMDHRLIPSLATLFQSSKYRTKRKPWKNRMPCSSSPITKLFVSICCCLFFIYTDCYSYPNQKRSVMANETDVLVTHRNANNNNSVMEQEPESITPALLIATSSQNQNCVPVCQCKWKSGKETANCDHRSLLTIPNGLSSTTQVLDISGNVLTQLPPMVFVKRGLINLQRIYLSNCHLAEISAESFVKLSNLIELDLSNNSLSSIPSRSLAECPGLRRLSLAGNRIRDVKSRSFLPLTNLNWLDLSRNVIFHLDTDAFIGLRSLQVLKLQSNHLQTIPSAQSFIQFLSTRVSLELHDNQWRCDCHLKPFRDWIYEYSIPLTIEPVCMMPPRLQGQTWSSITADQFSCPPNIHTVNSHFYKHIGNNVTIICSVSGFPTPKIYWLFESTNHVDEREDESVQPVKPKLDVDQEEDDSLLVDLKEEQQYLAKQRLQLPSNRYSIVHEREQLGVISSKLTVHSLQPIDTQRITCYAQNVGGVAMKNFTLIVSTQEPFSSSRSMDLLVSEFMLIVVSICILLLVLMIFLFVVIFRRKSNTPSTTGTGFSGTNQVTDSSHTLQPNHLAQDESEYRMLKPLPNGGTVLVNGDLINHQKFDATSPQSPKYLAQFQQPNGTIAGYNGLMTNTAAGSNILMVNTIDIVSPAAEPSISTDLSSQSTAATSINGNGRNASPNSNGLPPNPTIDGANSRINYRSSPSYDSMCTPQLQHCSAISTNRAQQQSLSLTQPQQQPDILISSNAYYLATAAPLCHPAAAQFPLLNSGPLFAGSLDQTNLIYGTTRIAPTRMTPALAKISKVKFADEFQQESSLDSTTSASSSSLSNAYTIATLRRNNINHNNSSNHLDSTALANRPLGVNHRSVASYPEGLRLVESSVDSGEPIRIAEHIDETEEDDYYRTIKQQQQQQQQ